MKKAQREVVISSPYFVPGAQGLALLRQLRARGVKLSEPDTTLWTRLKLWLLRPLVPASLL